MAAKRKKVPKPKPVKVCGRAKTSGEPCTQEAGKGTDHVGEGACRWHEDRKPQGVVATAHKLGIIAAVTPAEAIQGVLNLSAGQLAFVNAEVAALNDEDIWVGESEEKLNKYLRWQERLMDKVAKYAQTAASMGVAEREQALKEAQTAIFAAILERIVSDLKLSPAQKKALGPAIRKHLAPVQQKVKEAA